MAREVVEQIAKAPQGGLWKYEIVRDCGDNPEVHEIAEELRRIGIPIEGDKNPLTVTVGWIRRTVLVKAVSHLGRPHPEHKKRIQIRKEWQPYLQDSNTILLGAYRYNGTFLFVSFGTEKYAHNRLNNSSAHVYSVDLLNAAEYGTFEKTDMNGNKINVYDAKHISRLFGIDTSEEGQLEQDPPSKMLKDFAHTIEGAWRGYDCYTEMKKAEFSQWRQGEWPGFYLEYRFQSYIRNKPGSESVIRFVSRKNNGDIDLDLEFLNWNYLWDLKCHSDNSRAIPGNDMANFDRALKEYKKVWYVVLTHDTEKDSNHGYEVTKIWHELKWVEYDAKINSYGNRMKNSVEPKKLEILEINQFNRKYIVDFNQGRNPNGNKRKKKIQILKKDFGNFLVASFKLSD